MVPGEIEVKLFGGPYAGTHNVIVGTEAIEFEDDNGMVERYERQEDTLYVYEGLYTPTGTLLQGAMSQ